MGSTFCKVDDGGIKEVGGLSYLHNMQRFFNAILEQTK
jgi:hypothetical protein